MKKTLLFFIESLGCGGAEKSIVALLQSLDYDKVEVDLMLLVRRGELLPAVPKQVNIVAFPARRGPFFRLFSLLYSARWRFNDRRGLRRHKAETLWSSVGHAMPDIRKYYDVAIAYNQGFPTYFIANHVKAGQKLAWVNTDLKGAGYRERFNRRYYRKYDKVVAVSEELLGKLKSLNYAKEAQLITIYDIVNAEVVKQLASESAPLSDVNALKIVTVGRLVTHKNYPLAIETARILRDRGCDFVWTFVGGGPERDALSRLVEHYNLGDFIRFAGLQINPYPYMAAADIYVQTSRVEGFGLTVSEAKILNRPIVSTNFPVIYDQITDGINGLISEMTPEALADKIMLLVSDPCLRQRLTEATMLEQNTTAQTEVQKFYRLIGVDA